MADPASWHLDIYRRQARNLAWYDEEGEESTHNPFKKFRARPRRSNSIQLESRLAPVRTADGVRLSEERRRRRDMTEGLSGPEHALSFPPESSGTDRVSKMESIDRMDPEPSMHSTEPINVSAPADNPEGKPRQRKLFGKEEQLADDSANSSEFDRPVMEKPKYTVGNQIKATVFNSWINILILAAPAGSK